MSTTKSVRVSVEDLEYLETIFPGESYAEQMRLLIDKMRNMDTKIPSPNQDDVSNLITEDTQQLIDKAIETTNTTFEELINSGVQYESKRRITLYNKYADKTEENLDNGSGSVEHKVRFAIQKYFDEYMALTEDDKKQRRYPHITQTTIQRLTKSNMGSVIKFLSNQNNINWIYELETKMGLNPLENQTIRKYRTV